MTDRWHHRATDLQRSSVMLAGEALLPAYRGAKEINGTRAVNLTAVLCEKLTPLTTSGVEPDDRLG